MGTEFTSTGASGRDATLDCFYDRSVVTEASPARAFAFPTDSRLERKHGKTCHTHFEHRCELGPAGDGTLIRPSGSRMLDALLAGIADKLADDQSLPRPTWTKAKNRQLPTPWETPGTPRMRKAAYAQTPPQLAAHGIIASDDSLWRNLESVGV